MTTPHLSPVDDRPDIGEVLTALRRTLTESVEMSSEPAAGGLASGADLAVTGDLEDAVREMTEVWIRQVKRDLDASLAAARTTNRLDGSSRQPTPTESSHELGPIGIRHHRPAPTAQVQQVEQRFEQIDPQSDWDVSEPEHGSSPKAQSARRIVTNLALPLLAVLLFIAALLSWIG